MAGDTRDGSSPSQSTPPLPPPGATSPPPHITSSSPKIYEVFNAPSSPPPSAPSQSGPISANALPEGSGQNTAGANQEAPTLATAIKTVRIQDFKQVHMYPCVRESLLMGIGGAFGVGGVRALWGGKFIFVLGLFSSQFKVFCPLESVHPWTFLSVHMERSERTV